MRGVPALRHGDNRHQGATGDTLGDRPGEDASYLAQRPVLEHQERGAVQAADQVVDDPAVVDQLGGDRYVVASELLGPFRASSRVALAVSSMPPYTPA